VDDLPETISATIPQGATGAINPRYLREVERRHVLAVLKEEKGNKVHAAKVLGISRRALYRLLDKYQANEIHSQDDGSAAPC
jgi:DNA-binding NtrC family response regulator